MKRKQYVLLIVLTVVAGLIGGAVSNYMLMARAAVAQEVPMAEVIEAKTVRAKKFQLMGEAGSLRSIWSVDPYDEAGICFIDKNRKLLTSVTEAGLVVRDKNGERRMRVLGAGLLLFDQNGQMRVFMAVDLDGDPGLTLLDEHGILRAVLGTTTIKVTATGESRKRAESSLVLFDKDGKVMRELP